MYITNNYIKIYKKEFLDCDDFLLVFPNKNDIYFVFNKHNYGTTGYYSDEIEHYHYTEINAKLLFSDKSFLYSKVNENECYLLLSWYNKKNNLYYIIQLTKYKYEKNINIYELKSKKKTFSLKCPSIENGFITCNDNDPNQSDYLNVLTGTRMYTYNLENGNILKKYDIYNKCKEIGQFIQWNDRYIIFIIDNYFLKIFDLKINKFITVIKTNDDMCFIKKIKHQIYGESLLISDKSCSGINLWTT